ncbi:hypothetical protein [Aureibacter tunicatorum]|uniref:Uncharacterized protein n=1 Tax=Aureibacter tunicatorum TaxID=866807 RepID=A0AAE3XQW3_9BACT|nr:hypothetical protein [Aureibacter tunicatorum]MDR6241487.1 hypothetical protein [Aureibacter tunicatorum]BDD06670.1 hypothetical protein AUTU_41530 [Aureibacter tunicatorum]
MNFFDFFVVYEDVEYAMGFFNSTPTTSIEIGNIIQGKELVNGDKNGGKKFVMFLISLIPAGVIIFSILI